jgi:hypothetical protein
MIDRISSWRGWGKEAGIRAERKEYHSETDMHIGRIVADSDLQNSSAIAICTVVTLS